MHEFQINKLKHGTHLNHIRFKILMVDQLVLILNIYKGRDLQLNIYLHLQQKDKWLQVIQDLQPSRQICPSLTLNFHANFSA